MSGTPAICKIYHSLYAYADGANVIPAGELEPEPGFSGMIYALIGLFAAYWRYMRKDIC